MFACYAWTCARRQLVAPKTPCRAAAPRHPGAPACVPRRLRHPGRGGGGRGRTIGCFARRDVAHRTSPHGRRSSLRACAAATPRRGGTWRVVSLRAILRGLVEDRAERPADGRGHAARRLLVRSARSRAATAVVSGSRCANGLRKVGVDMPCWRYMPDSCLIFRFCSAAETPWSGPKLVSDIRGVGRP